MDTASAMTEGDPGHHAQEDQANPAHCEGMHGEERIPAEIARSCMEQKTRDHEK